MPVGFEVIPVLLLRLDVHVARVPVARFDARLRTPVRPDTELRIAEPFRNAVLLKRLRAAVEPAFGDRRESILRACLSPKYERRSQPQRIATCEITHVWHGSARSFAVGGGVAEGDKLSSKSMADARSASSEHVRCPKCLSIDVRFSKRRVWDSLLEMLFHWEVFRCRNCR